MPFKNPEYSCCHPSAAARVPYMCFRSNPHFSPCSGSSFGNMTYVGLSSSVDALKYAREMSTADICVRRSELPSRICRGLSGRSVAAIDRTLRRASMGGVGAKIASSPACRICRATSLERTLGHVLSPLFTSTHLTVMGGFHVTLRASAMGRFSQTSLLSNYSNSCRRAILTNSGGSG